MNKINVFHIVARKGEINGGREYLLQLADNFPKDKYKLFFALPWQKDFFGELEKRNIKSLIINIKPKFNICTFIKIKKFIKDNKIKIVHTHGARAGFYGRLAAKWANTAVILSTVHNSLQGYPIGKLKKRIYVLLDKLTSYFCDKLICVSGAIADELIHKSKINPRKILTIHNGIDVAKFDTVKETFYLEKEFDISEGQMVIGAIGRLVYYKGQHYLLEALPEVLKFFPDIRCLIVGDGPSKKELEKLAKDLSISRNCIFTGMRTDVPEILSFLDILVMPSLSEGFPIMLLEAMASGCPVIASEVGGVRELIENEKTGLLVPSRNSQALAEAIKKLLENKENALRLASFAQKAVKERFSLKRMIDETENVYRQLIDKKIQRK